MIASLIQFFQTSLRGFALSGLQTDVEFWVWRDFRLHIPCTPGSLAAIQPANTYSSFVQEQAIRNLTDLSGAFIVLTFASRHQLV